MIVFITLCPSISSLSVLGSCQCFIIMVVCFLRLCTFNCAVLFILISFICFALAIFSHFPFQLSVCPSMNNHVFSSLFLLHHIMFCQLVCLVCLRACFWDCISYLSGNLHDFVFWTFKNRYYKSL